MRQKCLFKKNNRGLKYLFKKNSRGLKIADGFKIVNATIGLKTTSLGRRLALVYRHKSGADLVSFHDIP